MEINPKDPKHASKFDPPRQEPVPSVRDSTSPLFPFAPCWARGDDYLRRIGVEEAIVMDEETGVVVRRKVGGHLGGVRS